MNEQIPDCALIQRSLQQDTRAYGQLVQRYQGSVFNVCYRLLANRQDAEDIAQETFIRAYRRLYTFDLSKPFAPWIRRIGHNLAINQLKSNKILWQSLIDEGKLPADTPSHDPADLQLQKEQATTIHEQLMELPAHYRVVIELRHFHEMSYEEIAGNLEIPLSSVKTHLFRARKLLAERLKAYV